MKQDESLQDEERESITASVVQRKWLALQKQFKHYYYAAVDPEASINFAYYRSMHNLFTDFATKKLNEKDATLGFLNTTTAADITNYVTNLLDASCNDGESETSPLECSSIVKSRASTICEKLSVMPKESVSIQREKLRIEPNTPFNSRYQLKTILTYRNPRLPSLNKRSLTSDYEYEPISKKRSQPFEDNQEITIIEATDESVDYQVEALDESNTELTIETIADSSAAASSTLMSSKQDHSVLDVPSYADESLDLLRASQNIQNGKVSIISDETLRVAASHTNFDEPPVWFQSFLSKYDADVNKLFSRIDEIDTKLNRFLASRPSVQSHALSRVTKFKRES